jgi:hypothetical protein
VSQTHVNQGTQLPSPTSVHHRAGCHTVTVPLRGLASAPVAASDRRPTWAGGLISAPAPSGRAPRSYFSLSHSSLALLCSRSRSPPAALLTVKCHSHCSPSPHKPGICTTVLVSTSWTHFKPELMAIASGTSTSLVAASSLMSSPSLAAARAPLAPRPLRGGPHDHVVHLCPHIHRWQPIV